MDMNKPVLVIMAAGMGSRYGGLKQIDPVDEQGHIIMDFSIYDARRAGFEEVFFIIKRENEQLFREAIGDRISKTMKVHYVFQEIEDLPEGFAPPKGRVKPWGTGHAVLSARNVIHGPFAVINADDYYGPEAFRLVYEFLTRPQEDGCCGTYVMAGYLLKNTLTDHGSVARGVCSTDASGSLTSITERTKIIRTTEGAAYSEDDGKTWTALDPDSVVSMNMWGFPESFMKELKERFPQFLESGLKENPEKCEYFLPFVVNDLMEEGKAGVKVFTVHDVWHGVTYAEDKQEVVAAMQELKLAGIYPETF
jgi:NDP-sugar pyrophosphorylase family protein